MYLLHEDETGDGIVSVAVPHGRDDIAQFILQACVAHQATLRHQEGKPSNA